jgi:hypothetical protein
MHVYMHMSISVFIYAYMYMIIFHEIEFENDEYIYLNTRSRIASLHCSQQQSIQLFKQWSDKTTRNYEYKS